MATKSHPHYYLTPLTLSNMYASALRAGGHGEAKGWHCPAGNDAYVLMESGQKFICKTDARNQVVLVPIEDEE